MRAPLPHAPQSARYLPCLDTEPIDGPLEAAMMAAARPTHSLIWNAPSFSGLVALSGCAPRRPRAIPCVCAADPEDARGGLCQRPPPPGRPPCRKSPDCVIGRGPIFRKAHFLQRAVPPKPTARLTNATIRRLIMDTIAISERKPEATAPSSPRCRCAKFRLPPRELLHTKFLDKLQGLRSRPPTRYFKHSE